MRAGSVSVAEFRPDLVEQWHERNLLSPTEVARGSGIKVWWRGPCGHEWEAPVDNRCYGNTGCPFCAQRGWKKVKSGLNDLQTRFPEIANQWHPTLNGNVKPHDILPGTKQYAWWLCPDCGREWRARLNTRTSRGTGCPSCRGRKRGVAVTGTDHRENLHPEWSPKNALALDDFSVASRHRAWWTCGNGHEWQAAIGDRNYKGTGCKQCGSGGTSAPEAALSEFVASLGEIVRNHHRQIDPRFEYDVTIPAKRIAIEFNGLYWHGEEKKGASYHLRKSQAAQEAGWTLLYVWEDDWRDRRQIVERMIARKLGASREPRINARQLEFRAVTSRQAREFLETNHIQGFVGGSAYGALCDGEAIHAVMVFKKSQDGFRLERYATDAIVRGGFSKLFGRMVEATGAKRVATFADRGVSDGSLYALNGFKKDGEIPPDYMYRVGTKRVHKFNYRIKRFRDDPSLRYQEGLTERELAALNGLDRVYDAGKVRWVWTPATVN